MPHRLRASSWLGKTLKAAWHSPVWVHYLVALVGPGLAVLLRFASQPLLHERFQLALFTIPIAIAAIAGGFFPGAVAVLLSVVLGRYVVEPYIYHDYPELMPDPAFQFQTTMILAAIWLFVCFVCDLMRSTALELDRALTDRDVARSNLNRILDRISDAIFTVNQSGQLVQVNQAFLRLLGVNEAPSEQLALSWIGTSPKQTFDPKFLAELASSETPVVVDVQEPRGTRWFHIRTFPDKDGTSFYVADMTSLKEIEMNREQVLLKERELRRKAEEANRLTDEFVATTSHELRTPLTTILGWTEIIGRRNKQPDLREGLEAIERSTRHQVQLIEDLLDVSRMATGKIRLDFQLVDLTEILQNVVRANHPRAIAKSVELVFHPPEEEFFARADPDRLAQIFSNLLSNAIKFTPSNGKITVELRSTGMKTNLVTISDTGVGIESHLLGEIFERFRQEHSGRSRQHGGLGLGLAIAKQLTESHGGKIEAASEGKGKGSSFTVTLPAVTIGRRLFMTNDEVDATPAPTPSLEGELILVVDDDEGSLSLIELVLSEAGARVAAVNSGQKALDWLRENRPSAMISDVGMPDMDGYELISRIRAQEKLDRTNPICAICLTAFTNWDEHNRAIEAGFDDYLTKPFESRRLIEAVRKLVDTN